MNQNQTTFLVNLQTFVPFGSLTQILPFRFSQLCGLEADESRTEYLGSAFLCYCSLSELSRAISCRAKQSGVRVQVYHDNANLVHSPADRDPVFESAQAWRLLRFNMWRATLEEKLPPSLNHSHWHELAVTRILTINYKVVLMSIGGSVPSYDPRTPPHCRGRSRFNSAQ